MSLLRTVGSWAFAGVATALTLGCNPGVEEAAAEGTAAANAGEVNVYSARHYDSDDAVFEAFTAATGIDVNRLEDNADALLQRLRNEGDNSPADVLITVDAGRLYQAEQQEIFAPLEASAALARIPEHLRHPDHLWVGFTKRARVIAYSKERVDPAELPSYEALAEPVWKGRLLVRSSSSVYNQSLVGSLIEAHGKAATEAWCRKLVGNLARKPQGGDRDQIKAIAAGEGDVAIVNSYYYAMMLEGSAAEQDAAAKVGLIFPNQADRGTHVNISGIGVLRGAPNPANAVKLIEFLVADEAQQMLAAGSNEFPTVPDVALKPTLAAMGTFKEDAVNASVFGSYNPVAIQLMDRAGWR